MEEKLSGIVLGGVNYGENDRIISVFTLEKGVVSAKIKGVKKAGAKLKFAAEPFCFAEFVFFTRADKRNVKTASLIDSFYSVREDIFKYFAGGTILEFLRKTLRDEIPARELFSLALDALKQLAYSDKNAKLILVEFLLSALFQTGYALNFDGCLSCGKDNPQRVFFDYNSGGFYCENCSEDGGREIKSRTFYTLKSVENDYLVDFDGLTDALKLLDYYIANKIEISIKSLKELIKLQS